ncbi:hypothetical protein ACRAWG_09690 [Methylobacterium sp. P31]
MPVKVTLNRPYPVREADLDLALIGIDTVAIRVCGTISGSVGFSSKMVVPTIALDGSGEAGSAFGVEGRNRDVQGSREGHHQDRACGSARSSSRRTSR